MKNRRKYLIPLAAILLLALIFEFYYYMNNTRRKAPIRQVSLIAYGSDTTRWESLKQGAELAGVDLNAEVTLITMSTEDDGKEQISLINREIENGADGLLIAACNSAEIAAYLQSHETQIPYCFVESGIASEEEGLRLISAENHEMGEALAHVIAENERDWIKVAIIADHTERDSVRDRLNGLVNSGLHYADEVVLWKRNEQERDKKAQFFLQRELTEEAVDVVVALDNSSLEELLDATLNLNKDIKIYGIANSAKTVYYLDKGMVKSIVYQDEFVIGYHAIQALLHQKTEKEINFHLVDRTNMYEEENQKLLFPHTK